MNTRNPLSPRATAGPRRGTAVMAGLILCVTLLLSGFHETATAAVQESAAQGIGYVEKIVGELKEIRIERDGQPLTPALLLPLQAGDRVTALTPGSELYAQVGNRRVVVTVRNSPYHIPAVDAPPGFITRLRSTLVSMGAKLTTQYVRSSSPVSTSSRGREGPLSLPLIEDGTSRISSNRTTLALAWDGGTPPFQVQILGPGGQPLAAADRDEWRVRLVLPAGGVPPGAIHITVQDRTGDTVRRSIEVVSPESVPAASPALSHQDLPPDLQQVMAADALIQTHRKRWAFEAYQNIAPLADSYEPARLLRDCLEMVPSCYHQ